MRHTAVELGRKARGRVADQIGLAHAREEARERRKPAGLGLAASDPENIAEAGERLRGGIRIGRLGIVDEQHAPFAADLLHPMRKTGKRAQALLNHGGCDAERKRRPARTGGVLGIVCATQRADLPQTGDRARGSA